MSTGTTDRDLVCRVEQFYYREARLLDERCFQQWLALLDPSIEYLIPSRHVPMPDPGARDTEAFLAVDRELGRIGPDASPLRHDRFLQLAMRAMRPYKVTAWAESPPPRTRRMITNVEVEPLDESGYRVYSNFHLFFSQGGADNHSYIGCRRDVLRDVEGQFRIVRREVITDWDIITGPTMALLF